MGWKEGALKRKHACHTTAGEAGQAIVLFGLMLTALLGLSALAVDGGSLYLLRRQTQSAADLAALAGAQRYYDGATADMISAARTYATSNGFSGAVVSVPPASGPHTGQAQYVEVIVEQSARTFFGGILGINSVPVSARAVARGGRDTPPYAIVAISPTARPAIGFDGGGQVFVGGAGMMSDSAGDPSINQGASAGDVRVEGPVNAVGPIDASANVVATAIRSGVPSYPDPLADMPAPYFDKLTPATRNGTWDHPQKLLIPAGGGALPPGAYNCQGDDHTFCPGVYWGGIQMNGGSYTMAPGIYIIAGGGVAVANGSLSGTDVFIYNTNDPFRPNGLGDYGPIAFSTNQGVQLQASHTPLYAGMADNVLIFQDRNATSVVSKMRITAVGNTDLVGVIYVPGNLVTITGGGATGVNHGQIIADRVNFAGSSSSGVQYSGEWAVVAPGSSLVE